MTTAIEWTDETWNPVVGCDRCSPGCDHCYAIGAAHRKLHPTHIGLTVRTTDGIDWTGQVHCLPERLEAPLAWRRPRRIFVNSMSDLFHPKIPDQFIAAVFATMSVATRHTFQMLTKRHARMAALLRSRDFVTLVVDHRGGAAGDFDWPLRNVWVGVSVEDQRYAQLRIPALIDTPAAVRWVSAEPLLGPVELGPWLRPKQPGPRLGWVVAGGESGPGARPMQPAWVRNLRDQCVAAGVPFLFKQWGAWGPDPTPGAPGKTPGARRVGKKAAGRELDGRTWDEYPT